MDTETETIEETEQTEAAGDTAETSEEWETDPNEETEEETPEEETESKPTISRAQKRINELTAARKKAEAERDYYAALAKKDGKQEPAQKPVEPSTPRPKQHDFETVADYEDALVDWKIEQLEHQAEQKKRAESADAERRELLAKGAEKYEDFEAVVTAEDLPLTPLMVEAAKRTDHVDDVLYALGSDPTAAREIATLSMTDPVSAAYRIFTMAQGFVNGEGQPPAPKKTTKAPAPIRPPKGGAPRTRKKPEDMTMEEYKRFRENGGGR